MTVTNLKHINPIHWIPPVDFPVFKIEVVTKSGDIYDLTNQIVSNVVDDNATESIGKFDVVLMNGDEFWNGKISGGDVYYYYKDYSTQATTKRFGGFIEKPSTYGGKLKLSGRSFSLKFQDKTVTKSFTATDGSDILKSLINLHGAGEFTYNNVIAATGVLMTIAWTKKNFWDCVKDICNSCGVECYVDFNKDFHLFISGSVINSTDGLVHDHNLYEVTEFATDTALIRNRITVTGATIDNVQVLYSADDVTSQNLYGIKEEPINDDNIVSYEQAKEIGDFLLAKDVNPPQTGECRGLLLATQQPGDKIMISDPINNIPPGSYICSGYIDTIDYDAGKFETLLKISKEPRSVSHIIKFLIESSNRQQNNSDNPEDMKFAYTFTFDSNSGTHNNTVISNGVLKLASGSSGTWFSDSRALPSNLKEVYLILNGQTLSGSAIYVSGNNGVDYELLTVKTKLTASSSKGMILKFKVVFSDATTEIDSMNGMYNLD